MSDFELYLSERNESVRLRVILEKAERRCAELAAALEIVLRIRDEAKAQVDDEGQPYLGGYGGDKIGTLKWGYKLELMEALDSLTNPAAILAQHDAEVERRVLERVGKVLNGLSQPVPMWVVWRDIEREFAPKGESDAKRD